MYGSNILKLNMFIFSGKLVSPKWKNFKGLKLLWRDKIRLNNAIWRAWYMQCKLKYVCLFLSLIDLICTVMFSKLVNFFAQSAALSTASYPTT